MNLFREARAKRTDCPVFAVIGCIGEHNSGDEALFMATVEIIRQRWPKAKIVAFSNDVKHTSAQYKVEAVSAVGLVSPSTMLGAIKNGATLAALKVIREIDCLVVCGGELVRTDFGIKATLTVFDRVIIARLFGKPVVAFGLGVGELGGGVHRSIFKFCLNSARVFLRDPDSNDNYKALCSRGGVLSCDLGMLLNPVLPDTAVPEGGWFAVCVRDPRGTRSVKLSEIQELPFKRKLAESLVAVSKRFNIRPVFVPFGFPPDSDLPYMEEVASLMGGEVGFDIVRQELRPDMLLGFLSGAKFVVGMRLHACVFGVRLGLPTVGIAYDKKVRKFMQYVNRENCCLSLLDVGRLEEVVGLAVADVRSCAGAASGSSGAELQEFRDEMIRALEESVSSRVV